MWSWILKHNLEVTRFLREGTPKPCSGYGNCDQLSRTCQCPINRRGSEDLCTVLLWFCWQKLLNFTATNKSAAQFSGLWHINNLDGLFFIIRKPAEYNFLTIGCNVLVIENLFLATKIYMSFFSWRLNRWWSTWIRLYNCATFNWKRQKSSIFPFSKIFSWYTNLFQRNICIKGPVRWN